MPQVPPVGVIQSICHCNLIKFSRVSGFHGHAPV
jgi:hypothetical protein